jgi:hypothetical protein
MSLLSLIGSFGAVLSEEGIVSDADLSYESSTFGTDQTSAIQAILNTASASNPLFLAWDCKVSVTGLRIKSYTHILVLPGCGAILRDGSDHHLLRNYNWTANNNSIVDYNITIDGGIWNGNGWRGGVAKQIHSTPTKGMIACWNFYGVQNFRAENFILINSRTFAGFFTTTRNLILNKFIVENQSGEINQDGFDIVGLLDGCTITNGVMTCSDDRLAFGSDAIGGGSASEGGDLTVNTGVAGVQQNIRIDNIYFKGEGKGLRFNSSVTQQRNVFVSNISGTARTTWLYIESSRNIAQNPAFDVVDGDGNALNMTFENIDVEISQVYGYDYLVDHHGEVQIGGVCRNIRLINFMRKNFTLSYPTLAVHNNYGTITVNGLYLEGYTAIETGTSFSGDHISIKSGTVNDLVIKDAVITMAGNNGADLLSIKSGSIVPVPKLINIRSSNITNVFDNESGTVTAVMANGIDHGGSSAAFNTANTIASLVLTHWRGTTKTAGTFTATSGDAY